VASAKIGRAFSLIHLQVRMDAKTLEPRSSDAPGVPEELRLKLGS
jgi:hypothetical protein